MTYTHDTVCACAFCVLEKQDLQLCNIMAVVGKAGLDIFFADAHIAHDTPENNKALKQIMTMMMRAEKSILNMKHGDAMTIAVPTGSSLSIERAPLKTIKYAWKICFHTKKTADEDPS